MSNHWPHAGVKAARLLLIAVCYLIAFPASAQQARRERARLLADKSISLAPSLHPRAQHALAVLVSEKRSQEVTQLDRDAALSTGKFARRVQSIAQSLSSVTATPVSASELTELGAAAGAAERKLFLALKEKRAQYNQAFKSPGSISLIQPLNLATIEAARLVRLRLGSLATEIPALDQ